MAVFENQLNAGADTRSRPNAVWSVRIANSKYFSSMTQEILISDVLIIMILTPSRDSTSNIFAATPEWDRMPTPIRDTLAMDSVTATDRAPISCDKR